MYHIIIVYIGVCVCVLESYNVKCKDALITFIDFHQVL